MIINSRPFRYHLYPTRASRINDNKQEENKVQFVNYAQVIQFLNMVYLPTNPMNEEIYESKSITNSDILAMVYKYTDLFDKKTVISFGKWCSNKVDFTAIPSVRKTHDSGKVNVRSLFVAKEQYIDDIAKGVIDYLPNYQLFIESLKKEEYNIVGYIRKSHSNESDETRIRLLQQMTTKLRVRSLVTKIFVSPRANAKDLIFERDLVKCADILKQLLWVLSKSIGLTPHAFQSRDYFNNSSSTDDYQTDSIISLTDLISSNNNNNNKYNFEFEDVSHEALESNPPQIIDDRNINLYKSLKQTKGTFICIKKLYV